MHWCLYSFDTLAFQQKPPAEPRMWKKSLEGRGRSELSAEKKKQRKIKTFREKHPCIGICTYIYLYTYDMFTFKIKAWTFISVTYPKKKKHFKFQRANYRSPLVKDYDSRSSFSPPVTFRADGPPMKTTTLRQSVVHEKMIAMNNKTCKFCQERWMLFLPYHFRFGRLSFFTVAWMACKWKHQPKKKDAKRLYQHWLPCTSAVQRYWEMVGFTMLDWMIGCDLSVIYSLSLCVWPRKHQMFDVLSVSRNIFFSCMFFSDIFLTSTKKNVWPLIIRCLTFTTDSMDVLLGGGKNNVWFKLGFASNTPPKFEDSSWKMMLGRLLSYWEGLFSGASS